MTPDELAGLVADIREEGSDLAELEVKRASGGFPESVNETLSAFGNTPGGGVLIFGLDEAQNFASVGVYDAAACQATLAAKARNAVEPPVQIESWRLDFEGTTVVVSQVQEVSSAGKPCRVASTKKAYLRAYDGDYELSEVEIQALVANRSTPTFDQEVVPGATLDDLDPQLLRSYLETCRSSSAALANFGDEELLFRTGVVDVRGGRNVTVAGVLALGSYPQQFFPNFVIQASVAPSASDPAGTRASDIRRFDGPIPLMMEGALRWVQRNTRTRLRFGSGGSVRDEPEFPIEAVRELLSNALIHRDLGPHALGKAITLKIDERQLVLSNPGGLWGITVDRLGKTGVTSARNGRLLRVCQNLRATDGGRVIEALASGIPTVLRSLSAAGMVPPRFMDQGINFTVLVPSHALLAADDLEWLASLPKASLSDRQRHVLVGMRHGVNWTNKSLRDMYPMDSREARRELQGLVDAGMAVAVGERGGRVYELAPGIASGADDQSGPSTSGPPAAAGDSVTGLGETAGGGAITTPEATDPAAGGANNRQTVLMALGDGPKSLQELTEATTLTTRQVQYALKILRDQNRVVLLGNRGRRDSQYEAVASE